MPDEEQLFIKYDQLIGRHKDFIEYMCKRASYGQVFYCREMVLECYLEVMNHMSEMKDGMSGWHEKLWIHGQCRHAITRCRRNMRHIPLLIPDDMLDMAPGAQPDVSQLTVEDFAACLNGAERRCFLLMVTGISDEELEQTLGLKHRSFIQLRHNIKKKLLEYIKN